MKKHLCFILTIVLISSLWSTIALGSTKNSITQIPALAKGVDLSDAANSSAVPSLYVEASSGTVIESGATFRLTLSGNAKWTAGSIASGYAVTPEGDQIATVSFLADLTSGNSLSIPLYFKTEDTAEVRLTVSNGSQNGISEGTYVVANAGRSNARQEISVTAEFTADKEGIFSGDVVFDSKNGVRATDLELVLPTGFTWVMDPEDISVKGTGAMSSFSLKNASIQSSRQKLILSLESKDTDADGVLTVSGLAIAPGEKAAFGEIMVEITGFGIINQGKVGFGAYEEPAEEDDDIAEEIIDEDDLEDDLEDEIEEGVTYKALLYPGDTTMLVNGQEVLMDTAPYIANGRIMLPLAWAASALGVDPAAISFDEELQQVTIENEDDVILITIGNSGAFKISGGTNEQPVDLLAPAVIKDNRTFIPLRAIAELLGAEVDWDEDSRTVTIEK